MKGTPWTGPVSSKGKGSGGDQSGTEKRGDVGERVSLECLDHAGV